MTKMKFLYKRVHGDSGNNVVVYKTFEWRFCECKDNKDLIVIEQVR